MSKTETMMPRGEQSVPAKGDNADKALKDYVSRCANIIGEISDLNSDLKEVLGEAKNAGFSKMAIRRTVKFLRLTTEQKDTKREVDDLTEHYTNLCQDLPLFKVAA